MNKDGFTLLEIVLALSVILITATIIVRSYSIFNVRVSLDRDVGRIASLLYRAKADTISGRGGLQYGVHLESNKAVFFEGSSYLEGAPTNEDYLLSSNIAISAINLTGGGNDVVFLKLTGTTEDSGTITVGIDSVGIADSKVITISNNGIITIQ